MVLIRRDEGYRRKYVAAARAGLIAGAALILCAASSNPPAPGGWNTQTQHEASPAQKHQDAKTAQDNPQQPVSVVIQQPIDKRNITAETKQEGQWYANPDWWVAGFTGLLFIATSALWLVTGLLWKSTRDMAKLAVKRPWIFISGVHEIKFVPDSEDEGRLPLATPRGRVFVEYCAANHGEAPAIVEEVFCEFMIVAEAFVPQVVQRDHQLMISPILGPAESVSIKEFLPQEMLQREGGFLFNRDDGTSTPPPNIPDEHDLFFWIIVRYRGISSAKHETSALWRWEKHGGFAFMQIGGEQRNYAK